MAFSVLLDTCVLYPTYLRDTLLRLASAETYRALWSAEILAELESALAEQIGDDAARVVPLMSDHFPDAAVTGHETLIDAMANDPKDRHVLAAAVRSNANAIVTFNTEDFPPASTDPYRIDVIHPDRFLLNQLDLAPGVFLATLRRQVEPYRRPPMDLHGLANALARAGCPELAAELRRHIEGDP